MLDALLPVLLLIGQAQLTDAGPAWRGDPDRRHIPLPGSAEPDLAPIKGFSCRSFVAYNKIQTSINIMQGGDTSCSGDVLDRRTGSFRQVNYLPTASGPLTVIIYSPSARIDGDSRFVMLLNGGPRAVAITTPLAQALVEKGYTVLMPLYLGEIETRHPSPDLPGAIEQVETLERWAGRRLLGTIGISAGAYLAAATCTSRCAPRVLLAPPLTTPEDEYADSRVDWSKSLSDICLWRQGGPDRVCAAERPIMRSFWGEHYYRKSLISLLKGKCARIRIVVSTDDRRVYDPQAVAGLRAAGCAVDTPPGYQHPQMDSDPALNRQTVELLQSVGGRAPIPQSDRPR